MFVHLHIGKCGGTSIDKTVGPIIKSLGHEYIGKIHFDWSYLERYHDPLVITMLRHPVHRTVSQFHFCKRLNWTQNLKIRDQTLTEYLNDPESMMQTRSVWRDGQSAVMWLAGIHSEGWVYMKNKNFEERDQMMLDIEKVCKLAVENLNKVFWFGIMEKLDESLNLLRHQINYSKKIILSHRNMTKYPPTSQSDFEKLESIVPCDMWLYRYALKLFEYRFRCFEDGLTVKIKDNLFFFPEKIIELEQIEENCNKSTKYIICFPNSPMGPLYYVKQGIKQGISNRAQSILPKKF